MSWSLDSVHIQWHLWPPTTVANMSSIRPWSLSNNKTNWLQLNGLTHQTPTGRSEHWLMEETWEYVTVEWLWGKFKLLPNCIISCCVASRKLTTQYIPYNIPTCCWGLKIKSWYILYSVYTYCTGCFSSTVKITKSPGGSEVTTEVMDRKHQCVNWRKIPVLKWTWPLMCTFIYKHT